MSPSSFALHEQPLDQHTQLIAVQGAVDRRRAPALERRVTALAAAGRTGVVMDISEVCDVERPMLSALLVGATQLRRRRGQLILVCTRPRLLEVFRITGMDALLDVAATREEAIDSLAVRAGGARASGALTAPA